MHELTKMVNSRLTYQHFVLVTNKVHDSLSSSSSFKRFFFENSSRVADSSMSKRMQKADGSAQNKHYKNLRKLIEQFFLTTFCSFLSSCRRCLRGLCWRPNDSKVYQPTYDSALSCTGQNDRSQPQQCGGHIAIPYVGAQYNPYLFLQPITVSTARHF